MSSPVDKNLVVENKESLQLPSPIITRRTRTASTCARALKNPLESGTIKYFSRAKGHGFVTPKDKNDDDLFIHISDVEGDFVPMAGDEVSYRLCSIPPKYEKHQAIHVNITKMTDACHQKWENPCEEEGHHVH